MPGAPSEVFKEKLSQQIYSVWEVIDEGTVPPGLGRPQAVPIKVAPECAQTGKAAQIQPQDCVEQESGWPWLGERGGSSVGAGLRVENPLGLGVPPRLSRSGEEGRGFPAPISRGTRVPIPGRCVPVIILQTGIAAAHTLPAMLPAQREPGMPAQGGGTLLLLPQKVLYW